MTMKLKTSSLFKKYGREIKNKRLMLNLSQEELAKLCGVSVTTIQNIESGYKTNSLAEVRKALRMLESMICKSRGE